MRLNKLLSILLIINVQFIKIQSLNNYFDRITGLLNHIEYTKQCGSYLNLNDLNITSFWTDKFKHELNELNGLLNNINDIIINNGTIDYYLIKTFNHFLFETNEETEIKGDDVVLSYGLILNNDDCYYLKRNSVNKTCDFIKSLNKSILNEDEIINNDCSLWYQDLKSYNKNWCGPYYDCELNQWILIYSTLMNNNNNNNNNNNRNAAMLKLNINNMDINQCDNSNDYLFRSTHKCKSNTKCIFKKGLGFRAGGYTCLCLNNDKSNKIFVNGNDAELEYWLSRNGKSFSYYINNFNKCPSCIKNCEISNILLYTLLSINLLCLFVILFIMALVYRSRKDKYIKYSMWILLEIILIGLSFIYLTLFIFLFNTNLTLCILQKWLRQIGFTLIYALFVLKLDKKSSEHKSIKSHKTSKGSYEFDIIKLLSFILIVTIGYLIIFTLNSLNDIYDDNISICKFKWWDYFFNASEFFILLIGIYYLSRLRPSLFTNNERYDYIKIFCLEITTSVIFNILKYLYWYKLSPNVIFIIYFIRIHLTATAILYLQIYDKLSILLKLKKDIHLIEENTAPMNKNINDDSIENNNNKLNIDNEEMRLELKRLYTQIHIHNIKSIKNKNPHILDQSKQKHGKLKSSQKKNQQQQQKNGISNNLNNNAETSLISTNVNTGLNKTPEDSICSNNDLKLASPINNTSSDERELSNQYYSNQYSSSSTSYT